MKPTIYLSNWGSHSTPGHHGPGKKWTIMARPRKFEQGAGTVIPLPPDPEDLADVRAGRMTVEQYRDAYLTAVREAVGRGWLLGPGKLEAATSKPHDYRTVGDGDTLCCSCSREAAARGECHRVWAARLLHDAGWRVVLDGVELQ